METLFSPAMRELAAMEAQDPAGTSDIVKWLTGNVGIARDLRAGKLVVVPSGSANTNPTDANVRHAIQGAALSMFCACLGDEEAMENHKEAKLWVPEMRKIATDGGIATTTSIVRLIDPARHLPFNMKIAVRHCGPCVEDFRYMSNWQYDGRVTECDGRDRFLIFGAPSIVPGSTTRTMGEQEDLLKDMSKKIGLLRLIHGSAALGALVALSHFHETGGEVTGQRLPAENIFARTGTESGGSRLDLRWGVDGRLDCGHWFWSDDGPRRVPLGCFALGVVELGH
ncbi:MAG: hypothetical protein HY980_00610 [Candidatus Magasanikbacteria bacterium]|nr:hypothetical protein [Candidatus Magasanikbacteria bacterium]